MEKADLDQLAGRELQSGQIIQPHTHEEGALPRDVYALLAQANLLRVRGHWEEAAEACMAALRLAPDSSSANSLLGDIYENQGRYDDAAQWYRMALDANPDSPADIVKLERLSQRQETQPGSSRLPAAGTPKSTEAAPPVRRALPRLVRDPELALRWGAIVAALGLVLVVAFAFRAVRHAGTLAALGFGGDPVVKSSLVVVPPRAGTLPTDPDAAFVHDPSEQSLLTALQGSQDLSRLGIAVYDVQADPRAGRMTITFGLSLSSDLTQAQIARDALRVLEAAGPEPSVTTYTARCLLVLSTGQSSLGQSSLGQSSLGQSSLGQSSLGQSSLGQSSLGQSSAALVFVGDASSTSVEASASAGAALTDTQAEAAFSDLWWSSTADIRT